MDSSAFITVPAHWFSLIYREKNGLVSYQFRKSCTTAKNNILSVVQKLSCLTKKIPNNPVVRP